jgi:hypothetical protein
VLGRVVNGSLVAVNENAVGTKVSRLVSTPTDRTTLQYFVIDGKARSRGVTQITVLPVVARAFSAYIG